jgi:heat shock protein HtpX
MPKINVIEDDSLNAFASGIDKASYTLSLSRELLINSMIRTGSRIAMN